MLKYIQKVSEAFKPDELKSSLGRIMCFYGRGDHGGGPTKENIESIKVLNGEFSDMCRLAFSSPDSYFEEDSGKSISLPVIKEEVGRFSNATVKVLEKGSVRGKVRIKSNFHNSTLIQDVILYRGLDIIEVKVVVDWHEKQRMLKLSFPVNVAAGPKATYQIPYGFIERPTNGEEEPGLAWVDVSDDDYGLSLVNDAKYSYDVQGSDLRLTILRSPVYAHHFPKTLESNVDYQYIDQGEQAFTYILIPHRGSWRKAFTVKWAESLNNPPIVLIEHCHKGRLSGSQSFMEMDKESMMVTVLKKAEDTDDIVLRLYETKGKSTETNIALFERSWKIPMNPCEIKTFLIPKDKKVSIKEINLLEF